MQNHNQNWKAGIVGLGKLGSVLADALARNNRLLWVKVNNPEQKQFAASIYKCPVFIDFSEIITLPELILLTVQDSKLESTAVSLASRFSGELAGKYIVHCSGTLSRDVIDICEDKGAIIAAIHPYQTFYFPNESLLHNVRWGMDLSGEAEFFTAFVKSLNGIPIILSGKTLENKPIYHASAVAASNFLTTVLQLSREIALESGIEPSEFIPIISGTTLENNIKAFEDNTPPPLTGPYARGDFEAIVKHIQLMRKKSSNLAGRYCLLGLAAAETSYNNGYISEPAYKKIITYLKNELHTTDFSVD